MPCMFVLVNHKVDLTNPENIEIHPKFPVNGQVVLSKSTGNIFILIILDEKECSAINSKSTDSDQILI